MTKKVGLYSVVESSRYPFVMALDESWEKCEPWVDRLSHEIWGFKVGSILFTEQGPKIVEDLKQRGAKVFLDLKYHDIPNTVKGAVKRAFDMGVDWLTVHASGGQAMLEAAASQQTDNQSVIAVTVLTSHDEADLKRIGYVKPLNELVQDWASAAVSAGVKGLVSSPHEVETLRKNFPDTLLITPGVRFQQVKDDQKRVMTPVEAMKAGSSCLVLGRTLTQAADWKVEWQKIKSSLEETF